MDLPMRGPAARPGVPGAVFSRYMLPKVAFGMITVASLGGVVLTGLRTGGAAWPALLARWGGQWALAALLGAQLWHLAYMVPAVRLRPVPGALAYGQAMVQLYRRWQAVLLPAAALLLAADLLPLRGRPEALPWLILAGAALALAAAAIRFRRQPPGPDRADGPGLVALAALAAATVALAGLHVRLQAGPWWLVLNRSLHLLAFSAWLGGALWNIFMAVPAGMARIGIDTAILANLMLERFRVVVRAVFPTIVVTGLVQAWAIYRFNWRALLDGPGGWLILTKAGLIAALVVVFILCPLWRACSPIRGACSLDDLD